jgi:DNA-binding CsgD family transcriptional regulator
MTRLGPLLSPLLIGRDDVLDLAGRRIAEAAEGRGQFLLIAGEAGIGKTRLLDAIERLANSKGLQSSAGALAPQDRDVPAAIFLDLARTLTRQLVFDDLGQQLLGLVDGVVEAKRPRRRLLVQQVVDLIGGAASKPTLLLFEDLQWADDLSLEILGELARQTRDARLLLAGAYRSDEAGTGPSLRDWRSRLLTQRLAEEARLGRLTLDETGLMTTLILNTGLPASRQVVAAVHERTDGVPLHVEELLGALGDDLLLDGRAIREAEVPDTIEDAILRRMRRLSTVAQEVARAGAVIGRCFVPEVLAGIMDVPLEWVDAPLQELIDNNVLDAPGLRGLYDYRHQLLRDALYRSVPVADRRRFHARAAEFGATLEGASEIHASLHYERAGMRTQAFRTAVAGAQTAARLSSHREAYELYRRAVENLPEDLPAAELAAILYAYSDEAGAVEENEISERLAREARDSYLEVGDSVAAAGALINVSACWRREGHPLDERMSVGEQTVSELEPLPPSAERDTWLAAAYSMLGWICMDAHDHERARRLMADAITLADRIRAVDERLQTTTGLAMLDVIEGRVEDGLATIRSIADEARRLGLESVGVTAFRDAALMATRSMDYRQAAFRMQDARRYADAIEQSHCARVMASTDAIVEWAAGDWDEALRIGEQSLADHGRGRAGAMAHWALGYVAMGRGQASDAEAHLGAALAFGERAKWLEMILPARWGMAESVLLAGDVDASVRECETALAECGVKGERELLVPFVVTGVRAYLAAGRPEAAERWLERVEQAIGPASSVAPPAFHHAHGLVRLAGGSLVAAREALEKAIAGWDALGRTWESQWARLDLAAALLRANRYVAATRLVGEVRTVARRLASTSLLDRASELEQRARGRGAEQEAWYPLTGREFEVARQIASGLTNPEIAEQLFVSPKTISSHVEHILAKLGVGRRAEIASWVVSVQPAERHGSAAVSGVARA